VQFLGALGRARLRVVAADLDVPELGVRHQQAAVNSALPIPVPKVSISTVPFWPTPAPNVISATPAASASFSTRTGLPVRCGTALPASSPDPGRVQVGRGPGHAVGDHSGEGDADRPGPAESGGELLHHVGDRVRQRRARRGDLLPVGKELARGHIYGRRLDAGTADVNPSACMGSA
jgi:hypothetical protein